MRTHSIWIVAMVIGCGSTAPTPAPVPETTPSPPASEGTPPPSQAPPATVVASAPYELHEWGVVDVPESGPVEVAAGAGQPQRPMSVRKPVVYAHLLDGVGETTFDLSVTLGGGSFVEHFPPATVTGAQLAWTGVVARSTHCADAAGSARRMPSPPCVSRDGVCEVSELPRYDAPSAACLDVSGTSGGLLFYRSEAPSVPLPLSVARATDLTVTATAAAGTHGTGTLLRISTNMAGPWPPGRVVIARAAFPAAGTSVSIPVGSEVLTRAQGTSELRTAITALGLTDDEASAFLAGWADELFGVEPGAARDATRESVRGFTGMPEGPRRQDVLLYFLPSDAIDAIAALRATPAPRAVRRAFMVRVDLGALSTG